MLGDQESYLPDDVLLSEHELVSKYNTSRITVHQANLILLIYSFYLLL